MTTVAHGNRIGYLDFLRGIAVLGLLLMNITDMGMFSFGYVSPDPTPVSDDLIQVLRMGVFDGRFRSLFCLLFGIGLYLQFESFSRNGSDAQAVLKRRLWWLLAIGFVHGILIWPGDILTAYALCGFLVIRHLDWNAQDLIKRGSVFFIIGIAFDLLLLASSWSSDTSGAEDSSMLYEYAKLMPEGYLGYVVENAIWVGSILAVFPFLLLFYVSSIMYLGLGLFKHGQLKSGFGKFGMWMLLVSTAVVSITDMLLYFFAPDIAYNVSGFFGSISGLTMAMLIWHWVLRSKVYLRKTFLTNAILRCGRMALTMYLMQSIVGVTLLRFIYPEWNLTATLLDFTLLALCMIVAQLFIAYHYFQYFTQGPIEFMWRKLVNVNANIGNIETSDNAKHS